MIVDKDDKELFDKLEKIESDFKRGFNPNARIGLIPSLIFIHPNPKKILDIPYPVMEQIFNNKEGSENWIKRIFEWFLGLGEFQWDAGPGEVKYPNQGFINTKMREQDGWHWATEVLIRKINYAKRTVKVINKYFSDKKVHALFVNDFTNTGDLNREIKYWIENGYHIIIVSCGKYCEGSTLPEVRYTLDLTDGEGYDGAFQFATRIQSSFYGYKNLISENGNNLTIQKTLFFKEQGYYITLSPSKHMNMIVNSLNIINDIKKGHFDTILNKIRNNSMLLGFDVDIMSIENVQSWIRENYYGMKLEGNIRSRISEISFNIDDYKDLIKKAIKSNKKSRSTEKRNKVENTNENVFILNENDQENKKDEKDSNNKEQKQMIELILFFTRMLIHFVKEDFHKALNIKSFNDILSIDDESFESFFEIPKKYISIWIEKDILRTSKETTESFFNNIFDLYNIFEQ